jgi:NADH dehydrogenase FAD-containing subunit
MTGVSGASVRGFMTEPSSKAAGGRLKVVLVGGGFANLTVLKELAEKDPKGKLELTLIDPKPSFYCGLVAQRALVDPQVARSALMPFESFWPNGRVSRIQDLAVSVDTVNSVVRCKNADEIPYDVLVVGTGRSYPPPFRLNVEGDGVAISEPAILSQIDAERNRIGRSNEINIVGGGATGVETAAEVKSRWPQKIVTLHHSGNALLSSQAELSETDRARVLKKLQNIGVTVVLGKRFDRTAVTGGEIIWTIGAEPNTKFLPNDWLDEKNCVKTDQHLLVDGTTNVFAVGDVVAGASPTVKTAMMQHAPVVAQNILKLASGGLPSAETQKLFFMFDGALGLALGPNESHAVGFFGRVLARRKRNGTMADSVFSRLQIKK